MAASMGGAWKAYLESLGWGVPAYRDGKPEDADPVRWLVIQEGIGLDTDLDGDAEDPASVPTVAELVQIDLLQKARSQVSATRTRSLEDYTLPGKIDRALRLSRALQPFAPWRIYGVTGVTRVRWPISDNLLRHTWTLTVHRADEETP